MRHYIPSWEAIGIKKERYLELLYFCRQYPTWLVEAQSLLGTHGQQIDSMPHGSGVGDPVAAAAERRLAIMEKIDLVNRCAMAVEDGKWYNVLIRNVCAGTRYSDLDPIMMPTSRRNDFFRARKAFFALLNEEKDRGRADDCD